MKWTQTKVNSWKDKTFTRFLWGNRIYISLIVIALFVAWIYIFLVSDGYWYWTSWPGVTNYYSELAAAFNHGQLSLLSKPDPALLELQNPYQNNSERRKIRYPYDASFYKGKFYLYWGPAPAIILAGIEILSPINIGDEQIVFIATLGLFVVNMLILLKLWKRYFHDTPMWTILVAVLVSGFASPLLWNLNRSEIYEAAITSGQFFLMGGFYLVCASFEKPVFASWKLALAGFCWALAISSRITLLLPVSFLVLMALLYLIKYLRENRLRLALLLACLTLPLLISLLGLGWYNWARFGSPLEFGYRFMLSGTDLSHVQLFSSNYLIPNLYNYLLNHFQVKPSFPYLFAEVGKNISFRTGSAVPLNSERTTGIVFSAPFMIFSIIPPLAWLKRRFLKTAPEASEAQSGERSRNLLEWVGLSLTGVVFLTFSSILVYYYETMRFLADVIPSLTLLSSLGFWQGYCYLRQNPISRYSYIFFSIGTAISSIMISMLLAMTGYSNGFQQLNPQLFNLIAEFFDHLLRVSH